MKSERESLIAKHGGYRNLKSFQIAQLVYDVTVRFCDRYIDRHSRTHDQMLQAARSGVQNIAEGSQAAGTSKKTELKFVEGATADPGNAQLSNNAGFVLTKPRSIPTRWFGFKRPSPQTPTAGSPT